MGVGDPTVFTGKDGLVRRFAVYKEHRIGLRIQLGVIGNAVDLHQIPQCHSICAICRRFDIPFDICRIRQIGIGL